MKQPVLLVQKHNLYLVQSPIGSNYAWFYILLDAVKKPIFDAKIGIESFDLQDFGQVLYSGWGKEPPADIKYSIEKQFS